MTSGALVCARIRGPWCNQTGSYRHAPSLSAFNQGTFEFVPDYQEDAQRITPKDPNKCSSHLPLAYQQADLRLRTSSNQKKTEA